MDIWQTLPPLSALSTTPHARSLWMTQTNNHFIIFLVAAQIILTTRRVNTAGSINATHTEASKAEEDFKKLQEQKKAQDLYLNKLTKDMEDLEQKSLDYQSQADAMLQQSDEIMNIVSTDRRRVSEF